MLFSNIEVRFINSDNGEILRTQQVSTAKNKFTVIDAVNLAEDANRDGHNIRPEGYDWTYTTIRTRTTRKLPSLDKRQIIDVELR